MGAIPFVGEAADGAKLARMGVKAADVAGDISDAARTVGVVEDAVKTSKITTDTIGMVTDAIDFSGFPKTIHIGKQGKHIIGHNNYVPGKSVISVPEEELQKLVRQYSGTGRGISGASKEVVDFGQVIGQYVDEITGKVRDTTIGTIHYSKNGVHIVPARPKR